MKTNKGRELRAALAHAGIAQYQLAVQLGIAPSKLSAFVNGHLSEAPAEEIARRIEQALGLMPGTLSSTHAPK